MQNFKMTLSKDQLNVVYGYVEIAAGIPAGSWRGAKEHKLLIALMVCIQKKLINKRTFPNSKNRISLTIPEAIAFYLMFNSANFSDPFELATMNPILTQIHKQYL